MKKLSVLLVVSVLLITNLWLTDRPQPEQPAKQSAVPIVGNAQNLRDAYERWKAGNTGDRITLALHWSKSLSTEFSDARGTATFDLVNGSISVKASGFSEQDALDVWLVDNLAGGSVRPEATDKLVHVGSLEPRAGSANFESSIPREFWGEFDLDLVVVTRGGKTPVESRLLSATPSLFQRLYSRDQRSAREGSQPVLAGFLLAPPVPVATPLPEYDGLEDLVAKGEDLFFNETFSGNGRTCGTCHPAENNFTIDPEFIATLPDDDPLFVAEFTPALSANFENPMLMREFGLILENLDGFGDLANRFVMRGVPHVLGLQLSIKPDESPGQPITPPNQRLGWSGDGAPNGGTLRDFATGAVIQHFTKTLARSEIGGDFRLPYEDELDALEAFQLTLGRDEEMNFLKLDLRDAGATRGLLVFNPNGAGKCGQCHVNGGANFILDPTVNRNFDTGVEEFLISHPDATAAMRPRDGGFGRNPQGEFDTVEETPEPENPGDPDGGGFGNRTFSTPSLIEFADTLPGFHNNITAGPGLPDTVESGVSFYNSAEFNASPEGLFIKGISMTDAEVADAGRLLRVINAMENERTAREYVERALANVSYTPGVTRLAFLANEEIDDAMRVLGEVGLHPRTRFYFRRAKILLNYAPRIRHTRWRRLFLGWGRYLLIRGRAYMVVE